MVESTVAWRFKNAKDKSIHFHTGFDAPDPINYAIERIKRMYRVSDSEFDILGVKTTYDGNQYSETVMMEVDGEMVFDPDIFEGNVNQRLMEKFHRKGVKHGKKVLQFGPS